MWVTQPWQGAHRTDVFTVHGELDLLTADVLFDRLVPAVLSAESDTVCVNMAAVTFLDLAGFDALTELGKMAAVLGKALVLVEPSEHVVRLIQLLGFGGGLREVVRAGRRTTCFRWAIPEAPEDADAACIPL